MRNFEIDFLRETIEIPRNYVDNCLGEIFGEDDNI